MNEMILITKGILLLLVTTLAVGGSGWLSLDHGIVADKEIEGVLAQPSLLNQLDQAVADESITVSKEGTSPLLQQAILFARYLDPPKPKVMKPFSESAEPKLIKTKPIVPKHVTPKFGEP